MDKLYEIVIVEAPTAVGSVEAPSCLSKLHLLCSYRTFLLVANVVIYECH